MTRDWQPKKNKSTQPAEAAPTGPRIVPRPQDGEWERRMGCGLRGVGEVEVGIINWFFALPLTCGNHLLLFVIG